MRPFVCSTIQRERIAMTDTEIIPDIKKSCSVSVGKHFVFGTGHLQLLLADIKREGLTLDDVHVFVTRKEFGWREK